MSGFEILNFRAIEKGSLRGFFSVQLPSGMVLHDCTLHIKDGARWVGLPSKRFQKKDGTVAYEPLIQFTSRKIADRFRDLVVAALDREGYGQPQEPAATREPSSEIRPGPPKADIPW